MTLPLFRRSTATILTQMWRGNSTALRSAGISEVVAVDLTREEFGIPVVRVIVPGLEGPTRGSFVPPRPAGHELIGSR